MGLIGVFKESKMLWKKASLPYKIFISASVFFSVSSVASLSDIVLKWRGFILDAIEFYRSFIVYPISTVLRWMGIYYETESVDYLILALLLYSSFIRLFWVNYLDQEVSFFNSAFNTFLICAGFSAAAYQLSGKGVTPTAVGFILLVGIYVLLNLVLKFDRNERVLMLTPIFIALLIISIFGAINAGLS